MESWSKSATPVALKPCTPNENDVDIEAFNRFQRQRYPGIEGCGRYDQIRITESRIVVCTSNEPVGEREFPSKSWKCIVQSAESFHPSWKSMQLCKVFAKDAKIRIVREKGPKHL
jgi:hypothetical protein